MSISRTSQDQSIKTNVPTTQETIYFFKASCKRGDILKQELGHKLSGLCETPWIEGHDCVLQFKYAFPKIVFALDVVSEWKDRQSTGKARGLKMSLYDS